MKSLLAAAAVIALLAPAAAAHADPAADALARYVAWRGGAPFAKAEGLAVAGTMDNGRFKGTVQRRMEPGRTLLREALQLLSDHPALRAIAAAAKMEQPR